jgi:hypothetical protein
MSLPSTLGRACAPAVLYTRSLPAGRTGASSQVVRQDSAGAVRCAVLLLSRQTRISSCDLERQLAHMLACRQYKDTSGQIHNLLTNDDIPRCADKLLKVQ